MDPDRTHRLDHSNLCSIRLTTIVLNPCWRRLSRYCCSPGSSGPTMRDHGASPTMRNGLPDLSRRCLRSAETVSGNTLDDLDRRRADPKRCALAAQVADRVVGRNGIDVRRPGCQTGVRERHPGRRADLYSVALHMVSHDPDIVRCWRPRQGDRTLRHRCRLEVRRRGRGLRVGGSAAGEEHLDILRCERPGVEPNIVNLTSRIRVLETTEAKRGGIGRRPDQNGRFERRNR